MTNLRDVIIRAWDRTEPCPDGYKADFCPSCLFENIVKVLEEQEQKVIAFRARSERNG